MDNQILLDIGKHLKLARKAKFPGDTQAMFAKRLGVGRRTYQKMEKGDPSVNFGAYLDVAKLLGCEHHFAELFKLPPDLFQLAGMR